MLGFAAGRTIRVAALSWALSLSGCAAYYAAGRGDDAMERRDYGAAVAEYADAVARKPGNAEYRQKLLSARQARAAGWLTEAAALGNSGDLNRAIARCQQVLSDVPDHPDGLRLHAQLSQNRATAAAQLEAAKGSLVARKDLAAAAASLRALLPLTPTFPELPVFVQRADDMVRSGQLDAQGTTQLQSGQFEPALAALTEAVRLDSGNSDAQGHLGQARDGYSAWLDQGAKTALSARRYSIAVPALQRAADLWGTVDAARAGGFRSRAGDVLAMLAKRARLSGERALLPRHLGLAWAQFQLALLLQAQVSTLRGGAEDVRALQDAAGRVLSPDALPNLEPDLIYPVALRVEGEPLWVERMDPMLRKELARYGGSGRVVLVGGDGENLAPLATIFLRLGQPGLATQPGQVAVRTQRYVSRIDVQPNPRHRRLMLRMDELSARLSQLDGAVAAAGQQANQAARRERRLDHAEQRARATHDETERRYRDAEARAGEQSERVARLERELSRAERQQASVESDLHNAKNPAQRRALEDELARLRAQVGSLRRGLGDARADRGRAVAIAEQLRMARTGGGEVRVLDNEHDEAERVARRAQSELDSVVNERNSVAGELEQTRQTLLRTPETIEVPVESDYQYSEQFFVRVARVDASLRLAETGMAAPLFSGSPYGDARVEDFRRDEHRVPGAPDLYIAPHPVRFPLDDEMVGRALAALAKESSSQLSRTLLGHGARFLRQAAATQGDVHLNALVLAHHAGAQILDKDALARAQAEVMAVIGLDVQNNRVNLAAFDGR